MSYPTVAMTACVKNEEDIIAAWLAFHLSQDVDHIYLHDTGSTDLTLSIIDKFIKVERLQSTNRITLIADNVPFDQSKLVTEMAVEAYHAGYTFVLNADVDEFYVAASGSLRAEFATVPDDVDVIGTVRRNVYGSLSGAGSWWQTMTSVDTRRINTAGAPLLRKQSHRAAPKIVVGAGAVVIYGAGNPKVWEIPGIEQMHFPERTIRQVVRKVVDGARSIYAAQLADPQVAYTWKDRASRAGQDLNAELHDRMVEGAQLVAGVSAGSLVIDTRVKRAVDGLARKGDLYSGGPAVIVPSIGDDPATHRLIADIRRDFPDTHVYVVDMATGYMPATQNEFVIRAGERVGWAGACNVGLAVAQHQGHPSYLLVDNGARLSPGFLHRLESIRIEQGSGIVFPARVAGWVHDSGGAYIDNVSRHEPSNAGSSQVAFGDSRCLLISHETLSEIGPLDTRTWPEFGSGCVRDMCIRSRRSAFSIVSTDAALVDMTSPYQLDEAGFVNNEFWSGMCAKWGSNFPVMMSMPPMAQVEMSR